ncbi:MAG: tetratricopeptide repeat protein [Bacteroidetes bacterium]|nr:tetratricopeptide repeat protein [Bacteroidota bacterium]
MKKSNLLFYIILTFAVVTAVYSNHFYNGFHFDDSHSIYDNANIRNLKNIPRFFKDGTTSSILPQNQSYRPVTTTSLAIDYWLGNGYDPFFFHLSTFILFLLQGLLMILFFNKLYGLSSANKNVIFVALFATAWYLLHPVEAETVNYIIARADIQSTLAVVAGFALYTCSPFCRRAFLYLLPVAIGILAKPPAVMFAPIFFIYVLMFEEGVSLSGIFRKTNLKPLWNAIKRSIPAFIVCGGLYILVDHFTPKSWQPGGNSPMHYLITQPFVILHYFVQLFWPTGLSADTDWAPLTSIMNIRFFAGCLFILVMLIIAFYTSAKKHLRPISFGILWFFLALAPTSSIIPLGEVLNDHRMFFPFVGLVLSISWAIGLVVFKLIDRKILRNPNLLWIPVLLLFIACGYGTWKRNEVWHSEESLWQNVTLKSPKNGRGLMNYGNILEGEGRYAEAQLYFDRALQLTPDYSYLYVNIAVLKQKMGYYSDADKYFIQGIRLGPNYPILFELYGEFLYDTKRYREAEWVLEKSLGMSEADMNTRRYLMKTFEALGEWANLKLLAEDTLKLVPGDAETLGFLEDAMKQKNKADVQLERAQLSPTPENYLQLSLDYYFDGRYGLSIDAANKALALRPNYAEAYNNIGSACIALQQFDKATKALKKALSLKPDYELAKNNLSQAENHKVDPITVLKPPTADDYINQGKLYFDSGLFGLCIAASESALDIKPDDDRAYNNLCASFNSLHKWDDAIKTGQKGLAINPNNQLLRNNLAVAMAMKNGSAKK